MNKLTNLSALRQKTSESSKQKNVTVMTVPDIKVPDIKDLDLSGIKVRYKGSDSPELNALIRIAKFSTNPREKEKARTELVRLYKEDVERQAKSYIKHGTAGKGVSITPKSNLMREASGDIFSAAWEGFFRALSLYDVESNVPFRSYFIMHIQHRCTKEFYTLTNHISGTDNKLWRHFLGWCGKQKRSRIKDMNWNDALAEAAEAIKCKPEQLNEIIRARKWNFAGVTQFSETFEEGEIATPVCSQEKCETYQWDISNRFRKPGEVDFAQTWDRLEEQMKEMGKRKVLPTRIDAARELLLLFKASGKPEDMVKQTAFVQLYREHIHKGTDETLSFKGVRTRKANVNSEKNKRRVQKVDSVVAKGSVRKGKLKKV
jgi:hypothetical protein